MDPPRLDLFTAIESNGIEFVSAAALETFRNAKTDYECFETIYYDLLKSNVLPNDETEEEKIITKTANESNYLRSKGDTAVRALDLQEALVWYTKSISAAPYPMCEMDVSTELAVAFGKRSAVYMEMGKYEAALKDITKALSFHYPDDLMYELLTRRFECFLELGNLEEAEQSLNDAGNLIDRGQPENRRSLLLKANKLLLCTRFFITMFKEERDKTKGNKTDKVARQKPRPSKTYGEHPQICSASNCLKIDINETFGRHLVSTRDINPGDILVIEEPYVATLLPNHYGTHCYNCLKRFDAMIPCKQCTLVMFCSDACRDSAWASFHDIECPILPYINQTDVDYIPPLALRMLITATKTVGGNSLQTLYDQIGFLEENGAIFGRSTGFDENHRYLSSSYLTAHLLCRNNIHNLYAEEQHSCVNLSYYLVAALIVNRLDRHTGFFRPPLRPPPSAPDLDWKVFVGSMFTLYSSIASTNGFAAVEHRLDSATKESHIVRIGCSIYNTMALLNHSCAHNTQTFLADGKTIVLYATQPIRSGEQLFINYGYFYGSQGLEERRSELAYHYFTCECVACAEDWPTEDELSARAATVLCSGCKLPLPPQPEARTVRCPSCEVVTDAGTRRERLAEILARVPTIKEEMFTAAGVDTDYTQEVSEYLTFVYEHFQMPIMAMLLLEDVLMENFFGKMGNHYV